MIGNYVLINDLTEEYVLSLVARNGYQVVTDQWPNRAPYVIQDLDGGVNMYYDLASLRTSMIEHWVIMNNG